MRLDWFGLENFWNTKLIQLYDFTHPRKTTWLLGIFLAELQYNLVLSWKISSVAQSFLNKSIEFSFYVRRKRCNIWRLEMYCKWSMEAKLPARMKNRLINLSWTNMIIHVTRCQLFSIQVFVAVTLTCQYYTYMKRSWVWLALRNVLTTK